jgi:predicted nucleic acid-binding protein
MTRLDPDAVFVTAITEAEILYGIEIMAPGKRRSALEMAVSKIFGEFAGRVLPFDDSAAQAFAKVSAARRTAGRPISQADAMIAATVRSHDATLATRNTTDFELCGIEVVNPWTRP